MPESDTSATASPASARATSRSATCGSRRSSQATSSRGSARALRVPACRRKVRGGDHALAPAERIERAQRDVAQVAERRRDDGEHVSTIELRTAVCVRAAVAVIRLPPFRTYRGRGDDAADPIEERVRERTPQACRRLAHGRAAWLGLARRIRSSATPARPRAGAARVSVYLCRQQPPLPAAAACRAAAVAFCPRRPLRRRRLRPWRLIVLGLLGALLVLVLWVGYGYWQFRGSLNAANSRVDARTRAALAPGARCFPTPRPRSCSAPTGGPNGGAGRSDSILLVRVDPARNRIAELSIPRDLRVTIPGHGDDRINVAYTLGGPALAIQTVRALTGIPINHVVLVDFSGFRELVDALGGVTIDNPAKIISNSFDGHPWRFGRGRLHLDGRHALAYARVRENTANPSDNDLTRGLRQQRVLQAIASGLASPGTLLHLPRASAARSASRSRPTSRPTT